jgi:hypothetical protein
MASSKFQKYGLKKKKSILKDELIKNFQNWNLYYVEKQDYKSILIGYVDDLFTKNNKQSVEWIKIQLFS